MIGVVVGNGPSKKLYSKHGDFIVGCNIPDKDHYIDATVICDEQLVPIVVKDFTLIQVPVIISTKVYEKMKEMRVEDSFIILDIFKLKDWHNSAHYAVDYLIKLGMSEIHLYGCDSIEENIIESTTDKHVRKDMDAERFLRYWRKVWDDKFQNDIKFLIHKQPK